jgi:hypothetical protein
MVKDMATKDNTTMVSRPRRKPDSSTKGRMNEWDNGYKEFVPTGTRESNRKMLKQLGNSSFYKSEGEKESSYSLHLNVDGKSEDPVAEMFEQFMVLTAEQQKQLPTLPENQQGRMLLDDGKGLKIWLDTENGKVSILSELECGPDIDRQLLQAQATMNVTLGRYRKEILNHESRELHELR